MGRPRDRQLEAFLREHGLTAERGSKHWKIRAADGTLLGIWPFSGNPGGHGARGKLNLVAQVRRHERAAEDGAQRRTGA